jgi:NDP-sugar pyrophosphorylase family protein
MKAMVLAAGLGTRLRPLTDDRPKALVEVAGRTMLEITLSRLRASGVHDVIVNVHHFADKIAEFLAANDNFGMHVEISREPTLLDTGGGLKKVAHFFLRDSSLVDEPFLLHNVDVISTIDLERMVRTHTASQALATLAVQHRGTTRYLLFDEMLELCGRHSGRDLSDLIVRPANQTHAFGFCGIHVISPRIFSLLAEEGAFSIIDSYLRLAAEGQRIVASPEDKSYWRDLGTSESVAQAAQDLSSHRIAIP